jgi:ABC-type bacteriocin/lantibiotic exporter with double-glycine peptidase domain
MEEVMDSYGRHLIAADILQEELNLGVWSVYGGLLREDGIALTAAYFGFNASLSHARTLDDVISLSNKGFPVIVSVRDSFYYPGGHLFVIRGGDSSYVYIADSSPANFQRMTHAMFSGMWQGFSAVLTPR